MIGRILGIDYGTKRVGIALSDEAQQFAFAKTVFQNNDTLLDTIAELAKSEGVVQFVVGASDNPSGGVNAIMRRIGIFRRALEVRTEMPVFEVSEAYSSAEARRVFEVKIKSRKEEKRPVDASAAAIILQTFLDSTQRAGNIKSSI